MAAALLDDIGACPFGHEALGGIILTSATMRQGLKLTALAAAAPAIRLRLSIEASVADIRFSCALRCNRRDTHMKRRLARFYYTKVLTILSHQFA
jgi:hypothetical protein